MEEVSQATSVAFTQANTDPSGMSSEEIYDEKKIYEVGFHIVPDLSDSDASAVAGSLRSEILKGDAEILAEGAPKRMTLAYRIERSVSGKKEKYTESYFGWIKFSAESAVTTALMNKIHGMHEIMRSLVIETVREEAVTSKRAVFISDRLEGATIQKHPVETSEKGQAVSEEDLNKSIDAIVL